MLFYDISTAEIVLYILNGKMPVWKCSINIRYEKGWEKLQKNPVRLTGNLVEIVTLFRYISLLI
jgi:hypothetical protein